MNSFWHSLQFRIPAVFTISLLFILLAIFAVFATVGKTMLEKQAYKQVILSGQNIVSELMGRVEHAESLAIALANLGEILPTKDDYWKRLARHIIDHGGSKVIIAGGGLWPEPYKYNPDLERSSFFWGRDKTGKLKFYDNYNKKSGPGYHHEEWYVPVKYLKSVKSFWSKSYIDPYSQEPMITVAVPMKRDNQFFGVSTIDLKLKGLHQYLEKITRSFSGYAFAMDRSGRFISFPDYKLTKLQGSASSQNQSGTFGSIQELAKKIPGFKILANEIDRINDDHIRKAIKTGRFNKDLAKLLDKNSYQITNDEAKLVTAIYSQSAGKDLEMHRARQVFLKKDTLLGEPAFAAVYEMPETFWKIVTVMPYSKAVEDSNAIYTNLLYSASIATYVFLIIIFFVIKAILVGPISNMLTELQELSEDDGPDKNNGEGRKFLTIPDKSELGELAQCFNQRSHKLFKVQDELRKSQDTLRLFSAHQDNVREEERKEIAREIHDELGQNLLALNMDLHWMNERLPESDKSLLEKSKKMSQLIDSTIKTAREITSSLRPPLLDEAGLEAAIDWYVEDYEKRHGIKCHLSVEMGDSVHELCNTSTVFRVFQEAMINIAKHAKASVVSITIVVANSKLVLNISDNGVGITPHDLKAVSGFGILGMRERTQSCAGKITITGYPGEGTVVRLEIPVSGGGDI